MASKNQATYISTTLPYVNADPHIGHAFELIHADSLARYYRLIGKNVFFSTGTDEHGQKIYKKAFEEKEDVINYVDKYALRFKNLTETLNLSNDNFIRTTDEDHIKAAQNLWQICDQKGDIYKKKYKGLYCVGCERFIKEDELEDGKCKDHPNTTPEEIEEENYFFKFNNYQKELIKYLESEEVIVPSWRREEALNFVKNGLEDFSISREKERMPWGIPVPGDENQVMYVWFDALTNYISTLGWPLEKEKFESFWQEGLTLQLAGKDQVRFQSLIWQAMLLSAGIKNTDKVIYHGFITSEGSKMSKSLGNVINPETLIEEYGRDALRYFLLRHINTFEDSDFTKEKFKNAYNAGLANSLGNLVSRVVKMAENYSVKVAFEIENEEMALSDEFTDWRKVIESFDIAKTMDYIWGEISSMEKYIAETEPYKLIKTDEEKAKEIIAYLMIRLWDISVMILPFLPDTAEKIQQYLVNLKVDTPLFERKD